MSEKERELLQELKKSLKKMFPKDCVDAYLEKPGAGSVTDTALKELKKVLNETR